MAAFHQLLECLKAILLHNRNIKPLILITHSVHNYESIEILLEANLYNAQKRRSSIFEDLKVVDILIGMQGKFTKYCWFVCLWNSSPAAENNIRREWYVRESYLPEVANIKNVFLVCRIKCKDTLTKQKSIRRKRAAKVIKKKDDWEGISIYSLMVSIIYQLLTKIEGCVKILVAKEKYMCFAWSVRFIYVVRNRNCFEAFSKNWLVLSGVVRNLIKFYVLNFVILLSL